MLDTNRLSLAAGDPTHADSRGASGAVGGAPLPIARLVAMLLASACLSQRHLVARSGFSKDQLSRILTGKRPLQLEEALKLLTAAGLPARGAIILAMFDRSELAIEWAGTGLCGFIETLIQHLPDALVQEAGADLHLVNPRWGKHAARFLAQHIARHIRGLIEREDKLGELEPGPR